MGFELNEAELPSAVWLKFDSISNHGASQIDIVSSLSPGLENLQPLPPLR